MFNLKSKIIYVYFYDAAFVITKNCTPAVISVAKSLDREKQSTVNLAVKVRYSITLSQKNMFKSICNATLMIF